MKPVEWTVTIPHEDTGLPLIVDLDVQVQVEMEDDGSLSFRDLKTRAFPTDDWSPVEMTHDCSLESVIAFRVIDILENDEGFRSHVREKSHAADPERHVHPGGFTQREHGTWNHAQTGVSR